VCLTGWLLEQLQALYHRTGQPLVRVHGPRDLTMRGGTITITLHDAAGRAFDDRRVEELANREGISLRTGCFCNPGAGEVAHGLDERIMGQFFQGERGLSFLELRDEVWKRFGKSISAVRISVGIVTNFADVFHFLTLARGFLDRTVEEVGPVEGIAAPHDERDSP
jgi:selenocysteine lyase/cysteine desulfurase